MAKAFTFQAGGVSSHPAQPLWLSLKKQPCFLLFEGFSLGQPVDFLQHLQEVEVTGS